MSKRNTLHLHDDPSAHEMARLLEQHLHLNTPSAPLRSNVNERDRQYAARREAWASRNGATSLAPLMLAALRTR